jgi:hypothetical protein
MTERTAVRVKLDDVPKFIKQFDGTNTTEKLVGGHSLFGYDNDLSAFHYRTGKIVCSRCASSALLLPRTPQQSWSQ